LGFEIEEEVLKIFREERGVNGALIVEGFE
jgi:hypothetical protein